MEEPQRRVPNHFGRDGFDSAQLRGQAARVAGKGFVVIQDVAHAAEAANHLQPLDHACLQAVHGGLDFRRLDAIGLDPLDFLPCRRLHAFEVHARLSRQPDLKDTRHLTAHLVGPEGLGQLPVYLETPDQPGILARG